MEFDNASNLNRKSGGSPFHCFCHTGADVKCGCAVLEKQRKQIIIIIPGTLGRTWGTQRFA